MKVVIAVHHFPPRYTSGAELRAYRTAAWLRDHGHDVHVVCVERIEAKGSGEGQGLTFEDDVYDGLSVRRLSFDMTAAPDPFRWTYDNLWIGEHMGGYLNELAPDVLHLVSGYLMSGSTLEAAMEVQIPTVVTLTDFWFLCPRMTLLRSNGQVCSPPFDAVRCARCLGEKKRRYRIPGRIVPGLMKVFWQRQQERVARIEARMAFLRERLDGAETIISPSRFLRDVFVEAGVAPERIVFCRQGRDFDLRPNLLEKTPAEYMRIGYMGQITPHKGVDILFKAVRQLSDANLEVKAYGDLTPFPDYTHRLRQMKRGDSRLRLAGVYERREVSRVLQEVDVVVVPSVWYENSPNTILEAFAHRTPVIVSNLGGMAELVEDGVNGLRFAPGDASDLAAKLELLINNPDLLSQLQEGIRPVKSVAEEMTELQGIYRSVVGGAG